MRAWRASTVTISWSSARPTAICRITRLRALAAAGDGSLWIGTPNGLTQYRDGKFKTFTDERTGCPMPRSRRLYADHDGTLWVVAGIYLSRYENGRFTNLRAQ